MIIKKLVVEEVTITPNQVVYRVLNPVNTNNFEAVRILRAAADDLEERLRFQ